MRVFFFSVYAWLLSSWISFSQAWPLWPFSGGQCHGSGIDRLSHLPGSTFPRSLCSDGSLSPGWPACVLPLGLVGRDQTAQPSGTGRGEGSRGKELTGRTAGTGRWQVHPTGKQVCGQLFTLHGEVGRALCRAL